MRRGHPPFLLTGGEIVLAILLVRMALWLVRGLRSGVQAPPPEPDGPGGLPIPATVVRLERSRSEAVVLEPVEASLRRAA